MIHFSVFFRTLGINRSFVPFLTLFLVSLVIFSIKKPDAPGEENKHTVIKIVAGTGIITGWIFLILTIVLHVRLASNTDVNEIVIYVLHLIIELIINLPISLIYINHTRKMKTYVTKSIKNSLHFILENVIFLPIKIIDLVYHICTFFKPTPKIYPTFD